MKLLVFVFLLIGGISASAAGPISCDKVLENDVDTEIVTAFREVKYADAFKIWEKYSLDQIIHAAISNREKREAATEPKLNKEDYFELNLKDPNVAETILFFKKTNDIETYVKAGILNIQQTLNSNSLNIQIQPRNEVMKAAIDMNITMDAMRGKTRDNYAITKSEFLHRLSLYPKSAFLNIKTNDQRIGYSGGTVLSYGTIGAVLKNEVKSRSIWASDDTLKMLHNPFYVNRGLSWDSKLEAEENKKYADLLDGHLGVFKEKALVPKRGYARMSGAVRMDSSTDYGEVLIFGPIDVQDIDHLIITIDKTKFIEPEVLERLKLFKKDIYGFLVNGQMIETKQLIWSAQSKN
jgi:hypothetical protein